jgi:hypothetical protein
MDKVLKPSDSVAMFRDNLCRDIVGAGLKWITLYNLQCVFMDCTSTEGYIAVANSYE